MQGDKVIWVDENNISRECTILNNYKNVLYDIILPERNVMFESIYKKITDSNQSLKEDDIIIYRKKGDINLAYVTKIDWNGKSVQIRILKQKVPASNLYIV